MGGESSYRGYTGYRGEYLNGKKHGKGKEYVDGELVFEGEYANGEKNGKGKEYLHGKLEFEGEYINGKKSGKEYFITSIKKLQKDISKEYNNKEKKIAFEFEIRGIKEDFEKNLNGASIEIKHESMNINLDHSENALQCISLHFEAKEESYIPKLQKESQSFFNKLRSAWFKDLYDFPFELSLRNNGKLVSIEILCVNGELSKFLLDLIKDINKYFGINFILKSAISLSEFLNPNDDISDLSKVLAIILSIKSETYNVKYFCQSIFREYRFVKIADIKIFDKALEYLDLINISFGSRIKFEYDAKVLAEEYVEKKDEIKKSVLEVLTRIIKGLPFLSILFKKEINPEALKIILGDPRYKNTLEFSIKMPGLSEGLENFKKLVE